MKNSLFYLLLLIWLCAGSACKNEEKVYDKETIEAAITSLQGVYEGELRLFEPSGFKGNITLHSQIVTADRVLQLSVPIDSLFIFLEHVHPNLTQQLPKGTTMNISASYAEFLQIDGRSKRFVLAPQTSTISFLDASNEKHTLQLLYSKVYGGNADGEFIMFNALIERMVYDGKEVTPYKPIQIHFEGDKKK